jgi:hypothetical protein
MEDVQPDQVVGELGSPPEQARSHFMLRLMQDNASLRLQLTRLDHRMPVMTPQLIEHINRVVLVPGTPEIKAAAEAALLRVLATLGATAVDCA